MPRSALLVLLLAAGPLAAADPSPAARPPVLPPPVEVVRRYDLTYAAAGGEKQQLDLAIPKAGGPHPCVVCLPGGAWKIGGRKDLSRPHPWYDVGVPDKGLIEVIASRGMAAVSVGYRLAPDHKFPAQIQDVKTAIRYLRANAKALNIDGDRIAVFGISAGGHLAALVGTTDKSAGLDGDLYPEQSSRVSCVVDFFGPTDLTLYAETPGIEKAFIVPLLGGSSKVKPDLYKLASPITHVTRDAAPFLIVHGTADVVVPIIHSERLHQKLLAAGAKSELVRVKGEGHGWGGAVARESTRQAAAFLAEHLGIKVK